MSLQNEVRIGNWVEILGNSKRLDFFTTIRPSSFSVNIDKTYGPIPLDEDWLQKFGFKMVELTDVFENFQYPYWAKDGVILLFNSSQPENTYKVGISEMRAGKYYAVLSIWVNKVHQLQNYYFEHTGTELELTQ
jgi:hypothetical protein